jgi:hypothetical protein
MTISGSRLQPIAACLAPAVAVFALLATGPDLSAQKPKFRPDDPLPREPETQDASKVQEWEIGLTADLLANLFGMPGGPASGERAHNANTIDEVPDSSWFTNRIYARPVSIEEITKGPNTIEGPAPGRWTIIRGKSAGVAPGFTARDEKGETWFVSFDGRGHPIAPTAAASVATRLFWALGYNQVETYLATIRKEHLAIDDGATIRAHGKRRRFVRADLDDVLRRAERSDDGSYRVMVGRALSGRPVGGFRYHDTRPDDPNDIVPHQHRRELRGMQVFGAWTNLVDMKAGNTLDTVVTENGRGIVRHYLQDVGSTFGTGALAPRDGDEGHEYLYDPGPTWARFLTFGFAVRQWQTLDYEEHPEIGKFEGNEFEPEEWKPRVPVAALRHARVDDTFWAALRVMAFTDEHIRAAVKAGQFTDPAAEKLLADVLIKRRDKIGRVYFSRINPLVRFALSDAGVLSFENPSVRAHFADAPKQGYQATWYAFDNATGEARQLGSASMSSQESVQGPRDLPRGLDAFVKVSVQAVEPPHAAWSTPVDVYFRRAGDAWKLVGVERGVGSKQTGSRQGGGK